MQSGHVILFFCFVVSLSDSAIQNVFNFRIPRRVHIEDNKSRFSDVINNFITRFHRLQNRKQTAKPNVVDILINGGNLKQKLTKFDFKNCGGIDGNITKLQLYPNPIYLPGSISIAASGYLNKTLSSPLEGVVTIKKDGMPYFCVGNACTFDDVCALLQGVTCPEPLVDAGIPCKCPFQKGTYDLPESVFEIDVDYVEPGNYNITAAVYSGGKKAACIEVSAEVK